MTSEIELPPNASIEALILFGGRILEDTSDSAKLDSQLLLSCVLDKPTSYLLTWPEKVIEQFQVDQFEILLNRRLQGEPVAYILGYKEFWSMPLKVSPATLIPRPDTEILVEQVLNEFSSSVDLDLRCLDLGTGTGAIALALASELPRWQFEAVDFNKDAVSLAQENADALAIKNITIYQSDWFTNIDKSKKFDVIVSNPPYIDKSDHHLTEGDVRFEPDSALVAENKGLADIEKIASGAKDFLLDNGAIFVEHGYQQAKNVATILSRLNYQQIKIIKDLSGNDRVTIARWVASSTT